MGWMYRPPLPGYLGFWQLPLSIRDIREGRKGDGSLHIWLDQGRNTSHAHTRSHTITASFLSGSDGRELCSSLLLLYSLLLLLVLVIIVDRVQISLALRFFYHTLLRISHQQRLLRWKTNTTCSLSFSANKRRDPRASGVSSGLDQG